MYLNLVLFIPVSRNRYQPIVFIYLFLQSWASKVITYLNGTNSAIIIITFRIKIIEATLLFVIDFDY